MVTICCSHDRNRRCLQIIEEPLCCIQKKTFLRRVQVEPPYPANFSCSASQLKRLLETQHTPSPKQSCVWSSPRPLGRTRHSPRVKAAAQHVPTWVVGMIPSTSTLHVPASLTRPRRAAPFPSSPARVTWYDIPDYTLQQPTCWLALEGQSKPVESVAASF